jgi:hypothetical protein
MSDTYQAELLAMARAAQHDERLSDGALYGKLVYEIERLQRSLDRLQKRYDNLLGLPHDNLNGEINFYKSEVRLLVAERNLMQEEICSLRRGNGT